MSKKDTRISVNKKNGLYLSGVHLFENSHDTPILLCEKKWPFYQRSAKNVPWNVMLFVSCNNSCCIDKQTLALRFIQASLHGLKKS